MPYKSKKPCSYPGCSMLVEAGETYCERHKKETRKNFDMYFRNKEHKELYDYRWQKASKAFLKKNPLCIKCKENGYIVPAEVTDHIKPHKGDKLLFWDEKNWQALCKKCHDKKTVKEDGGFGRNQTKAK